MPIIYNFTDDEYEQLRSISDCICSCCTHAYAVGYTNIEETLKRLIELRKKKKLTIAKLSAAVSVGEETLHGIESKKFLCDLKDLEMFSAFYDVSVEYLLAEDVQPEQLTLFG